MEVFELLIVALSLQFASARTVDQVIEDAYKVGARRPSDGSVLVDMDMRFTREQWKELNKTPDTWKAIIGERYRWTGKTLVYKITQTDFTAAQISTIKGGMDEWEKYTCIKFREYQFGDSNYVTVGSSDGCNSYVGMIGGNQYMSLNKYGCVYHATVVHEFGHAIGFQHEHQRPDRDDYITVQWDNVGSGWDFAFTKMSWNNVEDRGVSYDYWSVMHYGQTAFSHNNRDVTIKTKDTGLQYVIGAAPGLAFSDIKLANIIYKCGDACGGASCPSGGYRGKDCKCWCSSGDPFNPICECDTAGCPGSFCRDYNSNCEYWAGVGECQNNPGYMLYNCRKSCSLCS